MSLTRPGCVSRLLASCFKLPVSLGSSLSGTETGVDSSRGSEAADPGSVLMRLKIIQKLKNELKTISRLPGWGRGHKDVDNVEPAVLAGWGEREHVKAIRKQIPSEGQIIKGSDGGRAQSNAVSWQEWAQEDPANEGGLSRDSFQGGCRPGAERHPGNDRKTAPLSISWIFPGPHEFLTLLSLIAWITLQHQWNHLTLASFSIFSCKLVHFFTNFIQWQTHVQTHTVFSISVLSWMNIFLYGGIFSIYHNRNRFTKLFLAFPDLLLPL